MTSLDQKELFEQYYQNTYDFNTTSLTEEETADIKKFAREKRVDYAQAPLGVGIFSWILRQNENIRFETVAFDSDKIDGMLYIPATGKDRAYIILNANKPLINQIFTAAHEYYHYEKDYRQFKEKPYICDFSMLKDVNEKKASRFAAELLLPEEALHREIREYCRTLRISDHKKLNFNMYAVLIMILTVKYQIPLKAVIYRLAEERYILRVDKYIANYEFIKKVLQEIKILGERVYELYSPRNIYVLSYSATYQDMEKSFVYGNASKEDIRKDAKTLGLDMSLVEEIIAEESEQADDDVDDDRELFAIIKNRRG